MKMWIDIQLAIGSIQFYASKNRLSYYVIVAFSNSAYKIIRLIRCTGVTFMIIHIVLFKWHSFLFFFLLIILLSLSPKIALGYSWYVHICGSGDLLICLHHMKCSLFLYSFSCHILFSWYSETNAKLASMRTTSVKYYKLRDAKMRRKILLSVLVNYIFATKFACFQFCLFSEWKSFTVSSYGWSRLISSITMIFNIKNEFMHLR